MKDECGKKFLVPKSHREKQIGECVVRLVSNLGTREVVYIVYLLYVTIMLMIFILSKQPLQKVYPKEQHFNKQVPNMKNLNFFF